MPRDDQYHCLCCNPFHRGHRNIGFGMVVTGVFMICFQIAASTARAFGFRLNAGIWTGAMLMAAGGTAMTYQRKKNQTLYIVYGVLAHLTAFASLIVFGASVAGIHEDWATMLCDYSMYRWRLRSAECYKRDFKVSMHILLTCLSVVGMTLTMISAVIIWSQICCKAKEKVVDTAMGIQNYKKEPLVEHLETDV